MKKSVLIILIVLFANFSFAQIHYVSNDGSPTGNGSLTNPFDKISAAYNAAVSNGQQEVIKLLPGIYCETNTLVFTNENITISGYGDGSVIEDDIIVKSDISFADCYIQGSFSNNNSFAVNFNNVKCDDNNIDVESISGTWRDSSGTTHINNLIDPQNDFEAVNLDSMSNYVADAGFATEKYIDTKQMTTTNIVDNAVNLDKLNTTSVDTRYLKKSGDTAGILTVTNLYVYPGRLGVGTKAPTSLFHVKEITGGDGILHFEGCDGGFFRIDTFAGHVNLDNKKYGGVLYMGRDMVGNGYICLGKSGSGISYTLVIPTGSNPYAGKIGIGTSTPQAKLDVNGKIKSDQTSTNDSDNIVTTKKYVDDMFNNSPAGLPDTNIVWVSISGGDDAIGDGSMGTPYKTLSQSVIDNSYGKTIFICPGQYDLNEELVINDDIAIKGFGNREDIFLNSINNSNRIFAVTNGNVLIENMKMTSCSDYSSYGAAINAGTNNTVMARNCLFVGCGNNEAGGAICDVFAYNCTFNNCHTYAGGGGMYKGGAYNCTFDNCSGGYAGGGIHSGNAYNCTFNNCSAQSGDAMGSSDSKFCIINNCGSAAVNGGTHVGLIIDGKFQLDSQDIGTGTITTTNIQNDAITVNKLASDVDDKYLNADSSDTMNGQLTLGPLAGSSEGGQLNLLDKNNNPKWHLDVTPTGKLRIYETGDVSGKLFVTSDGDLGIGTSTPQAKLHVAGDVKIDGTISVTNNWVIGSSGATKQVIAINNSAAGSITWTSGTTKTVTHSLGITGGSYIVLITPTSDMNCNYYISDTSENSFTITTKGTSFNFNYLIIKK